MIYFSVVKMVYFSSVLHIYFIFAVVNGQKFGYNDRYTCHCKNSNNCDQDTGRCTNGCLQGWFGPNCQKENVALKKNTVQSSQYEEFVSGFAVDGNTNNENDALCSHTASPDNTGISYWQVDLGLIYPIREIKIYLRDPFAHRLEGYYINIVFFNGSSTVCKQPSSDIPGLKFTINVNCEGRYLRISNTKTYNPDAHVNLCEVEIYVCAAGTYGRNCDNFCYCQSVDERCTDGICPNGCASGFTTPSCDEKCYGNGCQFLCSNRKCKNNTSVCDIDTGICNGGCQIGYQLPDCRLQCSGGTYGDQCVNQCSDRRCVYSTNSCNVVTGECNGGCLEGYTGTDCRQVCSNNNYGRNCQNLCRERNCKGGADNSSCDNKSGECDSGCRVGYKPPDCKQRCDYKVNYGDQCSRNCSDRHCYYPRSPCHTETGNCYNSQCDPGYKPGDCYDKCDKDINYGSKCLKVCSHRNCSDTSSVSCDHVTGVCDGGCKPGYRLDDCSAECSYNYYGEGCNKKCSDRNCVSYSLRCDHITGECIDGCRNSYVGIDCTEKCPPGSYGDGCSKQCKDRQCKEVINEVCENLDGTCTDGCQPGYMGYDCIQRCKMGYYGENCNKTCQARRCNNGGNNDICNPETGACEQCLPGYTGIDCTRQCTDRKYGMNCQYDCDDRNCNNNTQCDFISGICEGGCQSGYKNDDCMLRIEQKGEMSTGAIVGIIVAVLCFIIMAGIIFIVFRKRRSEDNKYNKPREDIQDVIVYNQNKKKDIGPIYENSASVQNSKSETMPQATSKKLTNASQNQTKTLKPETVETQNHDTKTNTAVLKNPERNRDTDNEVKSENKLVLLKTENSEIKTDSKKVNSDDIYCNVDAPIKTNALQINKLKDHVSRLKNLKSSFNDIYQKLPSGFTSAYGDSQIEANRPKNRFKGYYPYDNNRVKLNKDKDDPHSDYINASYVDSYNQPKYFIAAQGPTKETIQDFVRMMFEEKCERVIMLTKLVESGKYKCERYWPLKKKEEFGNITVTLVEETIRSYYIVRKLTLENKKNGEVHETTQFHFTAWLDHDVPRTVQLLDFLYYVEDHKTTDTPVLVHCSAGIGRTGTYIAIDSLLKEGRETGKVDIQLRIKKMRMQRKDLIQTADQLKFMYEALAEAFETGRTDVPVSSYEELLKSDQSFSLTQLSRTDEFRLLQDTENKVDKNRIFITGCPNLNVYRTMSARNSRGYFISDLTGHDKETIWNLIMDEECEIVVYFSNKATKKIIPDSNEEDVGKYKLFSSSPTKLDNDIQLYTIQVQSEEVQKECKVLVVQTKQLHDKSSLTSALTELVYQVGLLDSTSTPVAVFHQSVRLAAMFCITRNITQRIKDNNEVEILNSTRQILEILPNAVNNMEDYSFVYDTTSSYINSQSVYENF